MDMTYKPEVEQSPKVPCDSVRIVIRSASDPSKFLLVEEADDKGNWKLPGGKFKEGETPEQAKDREALEELGLTGIIGVFTELLNNDGISKRFIFLAEANPEQIAPPSDDGDNPERISGHWWATLKEVEASTLKNRDHILAAVTAVSR